MASNIDETVPADDELVDKADLRANFSAAKDEIEALQRVSTYPWLLATGILSL